MSELTTARAIRSKRVLQGISSLAGMCSLLRLFTILSLSDCRQLHE
jgi:hypothetical protein